MVRLEELRDEPCVDRLSCEFRKAFQHLCAARSVEMLPVLRTEREDWARARVASGIGVAILRAYGIRHPELRAPPLVDPELSREVSLVRVRGRCLSEGAARSRAALRDAGCSTMQPPGAGEGR